MDPFVHCVRLAAVLAGAGYDAARHYQHVGKHGGKPFIDVSSEC